MGMNDKSMKKLDEMRAECRREDIGTGVRGKHNAGLEGKSKMPVRPKNTAPSHAAFAGTLSADFPDEITDDDLGTDVPRHEMDW